MTDIIALAPKSLRQRCHDWLKQTSTQTGLSLLLGGIGLAATHPFAKAQDIAVAMILAGLPKLLPDNTTDAIRNQDMANAIAHAAVTRRPADLEHAADTVAADLAAVAHVVGK
ncbi:MAG: hypothetical protein ACRYGR_02365 [Janthinobacterium lividum]